ncbi:MAG: glycosyltransferase family 39 protein [Phyllobacteriaceae bacterium]|nr:glycosyltransferase family 39 protein [Phyllobacteriaceae bacterium]
MNQPATDISTERQATRDLALLALVVALVAAAVAPATMLWDRDEGFYARTAAEMLSSGDWLVPTFNGAVFADKPPLLYWLMASSMALLGETEFAGRIVSAIAGAATAFFTGLIAFRLAGRGAAMWSAAIFATMAMAFYLASAVMLDATLTLFITVALWAFVEIVARARPVIAMLAVFSVALALGLLTKGPVAPAVVGGAVGLTLLLAPKADRPSARAIAGLLLAAVLSLLPFLAWLIPANARSGGVILDSGFGVHILGRALAPMEGHGGSGLGGYLATLLLYAPVVAIGVSPWLGFVAGGLAGFAKREAGDPLARALVFGWIAPAFLLFTLAATKLPHYIFPIFPALAIAAGILVAAAPARAGRVLRIGARAQFVLTVPAVIALAAAPVFIPGALGWIPGLAIAAYLFATGYAALRLMLRDRILPAARTILLATAVFWPAFYWFGLTGIDAGFKVTKPLALAIRRAAAADTPIYYENYVDPSFVFYLGRPPGSVGEILPEDLATAVDALRSRSTFVLVATSAAIVRIEDALGEKLARIDQHTAIDINMGVRNKTTIVAGRGLAPGG